MIPEGTDVNLDLAERAEKAEAQVAWLRDQLKASVELNNIREEQLRDELAQVTRLREACEFALAKAKAEWDAVNRHPGSHHAEYVHVLSAALTDTAREVPEPYREEYCNGCWVLECDFYDGDCTRQRFDQKDREIARLREALNSLLSALATGHHEIINRAVRKAEAALTDTAEKGDENA